MRFGLLVLLLSVTACPERQAIERGVQLTYRKPESAEPVRATVDRRLAHLKLKAALHEDDHTLTVRVPDGGDLVRIKALLARTGRLAFCPEDESIAAQWCRTEWHAPVETDRASTTCALAAPTRKDLETALGDAGIPLAYGTDRERAVVYVVHESECLTPRIVGAEVRPTSDGRPMLMVDFDRQGGRDFAKLTLNTVGHRLLISVEDVVTSAPVVMEAISGGRAMITSGGGEDLELLGALFVGGALPALTLEKEARYGPPSLR